MAGVCYQVNLQRGFGGGERYTVSFTRALDALGVRTVLFAHPEAGYWPRRLPQSARIVPVSSPAAIEPALPRAACWLAFHTPAREAEVAPLRAAGHRLTCFAHMPLYGRDAGVLRPYELVFAVSAHVLASLRAAGIDTGYAEPLYGAADVELGLAEGPIRFSSPYDWDRRKLRDRLFAVGYGVYERLRPRRAIERRAGIILGIVSRLTTIKQFPLLFEHLAPVLARHPVFRLDVFGAGGYASVRDLRRALAPLGGRVRFCGQQHDVASAYRSIDYLMTGLPEREALGLNVLEAQACGCPVLAVDAPPFTETVADEVTGLLYRDPRADGGAAFDRLLERLERAPFRIQPAAAEQLERFSMRALGQRVERLLEALAARGIVAERRLA